MHFLNNATIVNLFLKNYDHKIAEGFFLWSHSEVNLTKPNQVAERTEGRCIFQRKTSCTLALINVNKKETTNHWFFYNVPISLISQPWDPANFFCCVEFFRSTINNWKQIFCLRICVSLASGLDLWQFIFSKLPHTNISFPVQADHNISEY